MMRPSHLASTVVNKRYPAVAESNHLSVFTAIYEENTNIAIWQREQQDQLDQYAKQWCVKSPSHSPRLLVPTKTQGLNERLSELLPNLEGKEYFQEDVSLLVDMFACLFDVKEVGLRLTPLAQAMCPRFHVDNIPCRLVTTYGGLGTEWLLEEHLDRRRLGRGNDGLPDSESGIFTEQSAIQQMDSQHVALLKGSGWEGNEDYGLVHRSPSLLGNQTRLLMTLDFI